MFISYSFCLKVIYALNTKKDEHENMLLHLRDQHKEDLEKLGSQMKVKLLQYKEKLLEANKHHDRVVELEKLVSCQQERQKKFTDDFEDYQIEMTEKLHQAEINYRKRLWEFSGEMLEEKKVFQEKLKSFDKSEVFQSFFCTLLLPLYSLISKYSRLKCPFFA